MQQFLSSRNVLIVNKNRDGDKRKRAASVTVQGHRDTVRLKGYASGLDQRAMWTSTLLSCAV